jgi:hypothetical protein
MRPRWGFYTSVHLWGAVMRVWTRAFLFCPHVTRALLSPCLSPCGCGDGNIQIQKEYEQCPYKRVGRGMYNGFCEGWNYPQEAGITILPLIAI